jgi:hypothetical protein
MTVKSPRLKLGLVLISLLSPVLLTPPILSAARTNASKSVTAKKVSQENPARLERLKESVPQRAQRIVRPRATPKKSAVFLKGTARSSSRSSGKGSAGVAANAQAKRSQKTIYKQQQPELERIRDIQQALSDHGYPLEVNGAWDASTVEALKKFQTDQKIENLSLEGKLDSMTLRACLETT